MNFNLKKNRYGKGEKNRYGKGKKNRYGKGEKNRYGKGEKNRYGKGEKSVRRFSPYMIQHDVVDISNYELYQIKLFNILLTYGNFWSINNILRIQVTLSYGFKKI